MRISDWSSDVCFSGIVSVDIGEGDRVLGHAGAGVELADEVPASVGDPKPVGGVADVDDLEILVSTCCRSPVDAVRHVAERGSLRRSLSGGVDPLQLEIGRASCRERVCQYV